MAEQKYSPNDIISLSQDWGEDDLDLLRRPFSGRAVQQFVRNQLTDLGDEKFGHVEYDGGILTFYDKENGTAVSTITLSGTIYSINLFSETPQIFTALTSETIKVITITPSSKIGSIGQEMEDFLENYTWILAVDNGNGFINLANGTCLSGNSFSADVRPFLRIGNNRIRFSVTGNDSTQTKSIVFSCNLTSLTLNVLHDWQKAWIENVPFYINGIFFSGNMQKTLNVRIDDDDNKMYTQTFASSVSYVTTPLLLNISNLFPGTTGVHKIDIWISGGGVSTQHFIFNVMVVKSEDIHTAKLICLNEVKVPAINYENQVLFKYAVYGVNQATLSISGADSLHNYPIITNQIVAVNAEEKIPYSLRLEIPTEEQSDVTLNISAKADSFEQTKTLSVNNSNAFAAVEDAFFYMNASLRNNASSNRETILNDMLNASTVEYPAVWTGFTWDKDGWGTDDENVKCLAIQAGSTMNCPTLRPLSNVGAGQSVTLEWKLKTANVADYNTPIMSFMSESEYNESTTNGIIVFPTKILILNTLNRNVVQQSVIFEEGQQLHFVVVFQRGYATTGRNLCRIYINGVQQCVFEYDGSAAFGNGNLKVGQTSSDLYLYMLRYYNNTSLEASSVLKNWLNALTETLEYSRKGIRDDNDILDGVNINYDLTKQAGFNTMVIEMEGDVPIPSLNRTVGSNSHLTVEFNDNPEWNFRITNAPIDGQGTTSMRYFRWNLRWKLAKAKGSNPASIWYYADGSTSTTKGFFDGGLHVKTGRITAKKNIASSSQGHKMGAVAMYDDLFKQLGLNHDLPAGARVSTYQYPVMGFQKYSDGSYQFIGLYTIGPDKGDKDTFGYDAAVFPKYMSIEGPNHAPLGTRFLHPWNSDVSYNAVEETLQFGGEEGWDANNYNDDFYKTEASVTELFEQEWKPAYDLVYYCSPYLKSLAETGLTLSQINSDVVGFRNQSNLLGSRRNEVVTLYDENYDLIYYRNITKKYEILAGHNIVTYLGAYLSTSTPTTAELITARKAKFSAEVENYFDLENLLYHENFITLIGASDNHAKNTYPFKLKSLDEGGRWMFRQDDLDTILATDNNGNPTKEYYVEPGDLTPDGTDIWQGSSSVLWTLVREVHTTRLQAMMRDMINGLLVIAGRRNLTKSYMWETILAMFDDYFWKHASRYFPALAYAEDANFGYVDVWALDPQASYNGVYPLTQALGTQLEAEQQWALRRIIYVFSKYEIGGFTGSVSDGLNSIEFTPAQAFTFDLQPAIYLYPSGNLGGGTNVRGVRTPAGSVSQITASSDGTTTYYLKGLDWLTSIGDLSQLVLTSRGGVSTIPFSVKSKRLRNFKVGDAVAENVLFNATALSVEGQAIEEIDVRNVKSLITPVDLSNCPRLKKAKFEGSTVPTVYFPIGSKVDEISLPDSVQNIYLNGLPFLADAGLSISEDALESVRGLYINNLPKLSIFEVLRDVIDIPSNGLRFITMMIGTVSGTSDDITRLAKLTKPYNSETDEGYGRVLYDSTNKIYSYSGEKPNLQGTINVAGYAYIGEVTSLRNYFNNLSLNVSGYYVDFEDKIAQNIIVNAYGDGVGITPAQAAARTNMTGSGITGSAITGPLTWLNYFTGLTSMLNLFSNCKQLVSAGKFNLPPNNTSLSGTFVGCSSLTSLDASNWDLSKNTYTSNMFYGCSSLTSFLVGSGFFKASERVTSPLLTFDLGGMSAWVNVSQITAMLNALPNLTTLSRTGTLQLSANTKTVITNNNLGSIAPSKGWTIA